MMYRRLDWLLPSWLEDASAYEQSIDEDMLTIAYTIVLNFIIFIICVLSFSFTRRRNPKTYTPKAYLANEKTPPLLDHTTWFGWISELYHLDDQTVINSAGYDVLFFIRFYRLSFKICFYFSFYAWTVLLTINGLGHSESTTNSFDIWSMTNIQQGSSRCWAHLVGIYLLTGITVYLLEQEFVIYAKYRHVYLRQRKAHLRTVLVEGIPRQLRPAVTLATYFEAMYPNAVLHIHSGQDLLSLDKLVEKRLSIVSELERSIYIHHHMHYRPTVKVGNMVDKVDAIRYYTNQLEEMNIIITKEQDRIKQQAKSVDDKSKRTTLRVVEKFLQVTEMGALRKIFNKRSEKLNSHFVDNTTEAMSGLNRINNNNNGNNNNNSSNNNVYARNSCNNNHMTNNNNSTIGGYQGAASSSSNDKYLSNKNANDSSVLNNTNISIGSKIDSNGGNETNEISHNSNNNNKIILNSAATYFPPHSEDYIDENNYYNDDDYDDDYGVSNEDLDYNNIYEISCYEWIKKLASTTSVSEFRQVFRNGRYEINDNSYSGINNNRYNDNEGNSTNNDISDFYGFNFTQRVFGIRNNSNTTTNGYQTIPNDNIDDGIDNEMIDNSAEALLKNGSNKYNDEGNKDGTHNGYHNKSNSYNNKNENNRKKGGASGGDSEELKFLLNLSDDNEDHKMYLSKAFVTFKTFTAATIARQIIHMQLPGYLAISEAPLPSDIMWSNMYITRTSLFWRRIFVEFFVLTLIIVWVAPVTLLSYVLSEEALRTRFSLINEWCDEYEIFESFIGLLQPAALVALMNLLPPVLTFLAIVEGCLSLSANQFKSFDRYFTFQIMNVFLVTAIAGSVIDCVKAISLDPTLAFMLLGNSLPKMGAFFMNYIIVKSFTGLGMEIVRIPALFSAALKYLFSSNITLREKNAILFFGGVRSLANPGWFPYAKIYAQDMLLVVLCSTYACLSPLILAAGICYFGLASFIYKHQMCYVYESSSETGGKWWPKLAICYVVSLLFAQSTMVGMMILKTTYTEIYFLFIIIVLTSMYYYRVASIYVPLAAQLPFDMATSMDLGERDRKHSSAKEVELAGVDMYTQPSLRAGRDEPNLEFTYDIK